MRKTEAVLFPFRGLQQMPTIFNGLSEDKRPASALLATATLAPVANTPAVLKKSRRVKSFLILNTSVRTIY
jgi:hypothetical protein